MSHHIISLFGVPPMGSHLIQIEDKWFTLIIQYAIILWNCLLLSPSFDDSSHTNLLWFLNAPVNFFKCRPLPFILLWLEGFLYPQCSHGLYFVFWCFLKCHFLSEAFSLQPSWFWHLKTALFHTSLVFISV